MKALTLKEMEVCAAHKARDRLVKILKATYEDYHGHFSAMGCDTEKSLPFHDTAVKHTLLENPVTLRVTFYILAFTKIKGVIYDAEHEIFSMEIQKNDNFDNFRQKCEALYNFWDLMRYENMLRRTAKVSKGMSEDMKRKMGRYYQQEKEKHYAFPFKFPRDLGRPEGTFAW